MAKLARFEARVALEIPSPGRLFRRLKSIVSPRRRAVAAEAGDPTTIAPRDAGWAELFTADGATRMGRGHLMIWPGHHHDEASDDGPPRVAKDAGLPLGGDAPPLRGELRSFVVDAGPPVPGDSLAVRPENESQLYPVLVQSYDTQGQPVVRLDWPDEQLPAALRELGGN